MSWFFKKKVSEEDFKQLKQAVQTGFNSVKQDIGKTSAWIKHLDSNNSQVKDEIFELNQEIASMKDEIENLRNMIGMMGSSGNFKQVFKQGQTVFNKQTPVQGVLNSVQTGVQTVFLDKLSTTERAIIFVLLNSDMKLSYEDLAAMMGKSKATIRGQINSIRQKCENLVEEQISENNKKRVYIPENMREILLKTRKVRAKTKKDSEKQ
ncbi:MAG: hypothetical protein WC438_01840 [Candidatus Pacearchaeota archaeon]